MTSEVWYGVIGTVVAGIVVAAIVGGAKLILDGKKEFEAKISALEEEKELAQVNALSTMSKSMESLSKELRDHTYALAKMDAKIDEFKKDRDMIPKLVNDMNSLHLWRREVDKRRFDEPEAEENS